MSDKNWDLYVDTRKLEFLPVVLASLGAFLFLAASRDFIFNDFEPPVWVTLLDVVSLGVFVITFAVTWLKWLRPGDAKIFLFMCFATVCLRPSVIATFDDTPATLVLCSVIFASGLIFLSRSYMIASQVLIVGSWSLVSWDQLFTPQYLVSLVMGLVTVGLAYWMYRTRLKALRRNFDLETRVEDLETIVPICSNCKKTRDQSGNWLSIEEYIESSESAQISHGVCPACKEELYGDVLERQRARDQAKAS